MTHYTNGDRISDGLSIYLGINPLFDSDGDGLSNTEEELLGTNIFSSDSDGDGVGDATDAYPLDPLRTEDLIAVPDDVSAPTITLDEPMDAILLP